jgi:hypothetical protein
MTLKAIKDDYYYYVDVKVSMVGLQVHVLDSVNVRVVFWLKIFGVIFIVRRTEHQRE